MRIDRLDLLRFGKFTDRSLALPAANRDIHILVGPNEAGKSTVRAAVADLLYGIPARTPHAFVHAMPELRLAARLQHAGQVLELQRVKGNKNTVRAADGSPLPDAALAPFLGPTDREFFLQMFGLDHARLVQGGHSILSAGDDLGQILFQSAAGIAQLGPVRDALEAEADKLWSRRRAGDRAFYVASDALDHASAALKQATLRSRDWAEAQARAADLDSQAQAVRAQLAQLRQRRSQLERVRRVRPHLAAQAALAAELAALGSVPSLPQDAADTLAQARQALAAAGLAQAHHGQVLAAAQAALAGLDDAPALRAAADAVTDLNERRLEYRGHPAELQRHQTAQAGLFARAASAAAALGWPGDDPAPWRSRLPAAPRRQALAQLLQQQAGLAQALAAAQRAEAGKRAELAQVQQALQDLPAPAPAWALQAALEQAQALGDAASTLRQQAQAVAQADARVAQAQQALAPWPLDLAACRALTPPAPELLPVLAQQDAQDQAQARNAEQRALALAHEATQAEADLAAWVQTHDPVTREQVATARAQRDQTWQALQAEPALLAQQAPQLSQQMRRADALADRSHATAEAASTLHGLQAQVARLRLQQQQALAEQQAAAQAQQRRADDWASLARQCGLPALPFAAAGPWLAARQALLAADEQRSQAVSSHQAWRQAAATACQALAEALSAALGAAPADPGPAPAPGGLAASGGLCTNTAAGADAAAVAGAGSAATSTASPTAIPKAAPKTAAVAATETTPPAGLASALPDERLGALLARLAAQASQALTDAAKLDGQRQSLQRQLADDQRDAVTLAHDAASAQAALDTWAAQWAEQRTLNALPPQASPAEAAAHLAQLDSLDQALTAADDLARTHSAPLLADLARLAEQAEALARRLAPELSGQTPDAVAQALAGRLAVAQAAHAEASRQRQAAAAAEQALHQAQVQAGTAQARLRPVLSAAGLPSGALQPPEAQARAQDQAEAQAQPQPQTLALADLDALAALVGQSDQRHQLQAALAAATQALRDSGDGLAADTLRQEAEALPPDALAAELQAGTSDEEALVNRLAALAAERQQVATRLDAMAGSADAAQAEGQRQEALAQMGEAVARYLQVRTAARLLRWATERYREERQGPLLAQASQVFAALTSGAFERLVVDADTEPPTLRARRPDGALLGVEALSEGTRDQLFLALRLAALHMHVGSGAGPAPAGPGAGAGSSAGPASAPPSGTGHALPFIADDLFINYDDQRAAAGLHALGELSRHTQVLFLTHHDHLLPVVRQVLGEGVNVVWL